MKVIRRTAEGLSVLLVLKALLFSCREIVLFALTNLTLSCSLLPVYKRLFRKSTDSFVRKNGNHH